MGKTNGVEYVQLESLLTEREISYRNRVRRFVNEECMPIIVEHFDKGHFPMDLIPRMAEMDLFGLHVEGYGCKKASHTIYGLACQELGRWGYRDETGLRGRTCARTPPQQRLAYPGSGAGRSELRETIHKSLLFFSSGKK